MQISEIEQKTISGGGDTGYKSSIRNLTAPFGLESLMVHEETLQPGDNGSRPHFHSSKEELIIVLEGKLQITCGDASETLTSGSVFGFPPGPAHRHYVTNIGDQDAKYISVSICDPEDEVVYE